MNTTTNAVTTSVATTLRKTSRPAAATLPQRKAPILPVVQRQPLSVLQTGRAPAQLSLFLRPSINLR
jgi:hypothetical protein